MKTVLTDNSLCAYPLCDNADPDLIYGYISALKSTGVKYVELDFRTLMKLHKLPEGVGYIFRMVDPMFQQLADYFDFKYIVLTYADLKRKIKTNVPVMFETPYVKGNMGRIPDFVKSRVEGEVAAVRVRSAFGYERPSDIGEIFRELCMGCRPLSIDVCPLNTCRTALDAALKFTAVNADSITVTAGLPSKYCSLEDYLFSLMTVFGNISSDYDIRSLGRVSVYRSRIFQLGEQALPALLDTLDHDIRCLKNADTGERVGLRISLRDSEYLDRPFVSALEKMADAEGIPDDVFEDLVGAMNHYDRGVFNDELLHRRQSGLLN